VAATTTPPPPTLHVTSVNIARLTCSGTSSYTPLAAVTVQSDGAAAGTLTLTWIHSTSKESRGTTVATESVALKKGQTSSTVTYSHDFGYYDVYPYWGLAVSTTPAAGTGNSSYQLIPACIPIIS
jgi:serine/threonine-protein kinase